MKQTIRAVALALGTLLAVACASEHVTGAHAGPGQGILAMRLTDAPTPLDSIKEVNLFVVRIDARRAHTDSALVDVDIEHEEHESVHYDNGAAPDSTRWVTIATPNATFNLLALQNGVSAFLGATPVDTGQFRGVRVVIDPLQSTVVLQDGTVLSPTSTPPVEFGKAGRHGLFVELQDSLDVDAGVTTTLTLDLKLNRSLTLRGLSVRDGFFFRPVVIGRSRHDH